MESDRFDVWLADGYLFFRASTCATAACVLVAGVARHAGLSISPAG